MGWKFLAIACRERFETVPYDSEPMNIIEKLISASGEHL